MRTFWDFVGWPVFYVRCCIHVSLVRWLLVIFVVNVKENGRHRFVYIFRNCISLIFWLTLTFTRLLSYWNVTYIWSVCIARDVAAIKCLKSTKITILDLTNVMTSTVVYTERLKWLFGGAYCAAEKECSVSVDLFFNLIDVFISICFLNSYLPVTMYLLCKRFIIHYMHESGHGLYTLYMHVS